MISIRVQIGCTGGEGGVRSFVSFLMVLKINIGCINPSLVYNIIEVIFMLVNTKDMISLTEANQNFSKVARKVDEKGSVLIMKNNNPAYVVIDFKRIEELQISGKDRIETISSRILEDNLEAFKELAK